MIARGTDRSEEQTNILIVEDRRENLLALEAALEALGQRLVKATTGREALRAALEDDFAVILLDIRLPELDGFETAHLLRERSRNRRTPIIFLTGIDKDDEQVSKGYALGAVDYIFKPADPDILRSKVSVFIDLYRKSRQIERLNRSLEGRVRERTRELQAANEELARQVAERRRVEAEVRSLNEDLEARVKARTRELESLNDELRSFSYSVSHDLRAPLRKIETFVELLLHEYHDALDDTASMYLDRIQQNSRHMGALIGEILKLSRISREQMHWRDIDLSALTREIVDEIRREEPSRVVDVRVEDGMHVYGDPSLLRIALDNLISNAWKFTSRTEEACIECVRVEVDGAVAFSVRDNGAGFRMEHAGKLFQPFQRLHPASSFPGTGIGLAIVHRIVRRHGGDIQAEGKEHEGAVFTVSLPAH
jgi:hypothetical protein